MSVLKCIFKCKEPETERVNAFTEQAYDEVKKVSKIRKHCGLKYKEINFSDVLSAEDGYHRNCRKNFVKVDARYRQQYDQGRFIGALLIFVLMNSFLLRMLIEQINY